MKKLSEVIKNPSGFDSLSNYIGETEFEDFEVVLTQSRDSDILTRSNWECALKQLGGESENVRIDRFGHWACGWWQALSVRPGTSEYTIAQDIEGAIADYPVLDESHYCELENNEAQKVWANCYNDRERLTYIREHESHFEFSSCADLFAAVRGRYFNGDASELLN